MDIPMVYFINLPAKPTWPSKLAVSTVGGCLAVISSRSLTLYVSLVRIASEPRRVFGEASIFIYQNT